MHVDGPAHKLDKLLSDCGTETRPAIAPGGRIICLHKLLEYPLLRLWRNSNSRVAYCEAHSEALRRFVKQHSRNINMAPLGKFDCVRQKVHQHLPKVMWVTLHMVVD